ncbi:hypothetical protein OCU04_003093 [Sclerotinia nivalis]|uniref:Uncharacterized protein n=1 Tax=Sclerotinia nivalis TaxID=352851 RepID=A0A9X0DN70_9HELO|nr:hypothetical protein OCU04_003093 [Sclerotinia nivalis]
MCNAEIAAALPTPYCSSVMRTLSAALALDMRTKSFKLVFKKAGDVGLDLYLDMDHSQLLLHDKWMDFDKSHAENSKDCILSHMRHPGDDSPIEIFSCDHIIIDICNQVLQELDRGGAGKIFPDDQHLNSLPLQVGECLKNMLRAIQARPGPNKGEICVSWEDNEAGKLFRLHNMVLNCCVTLHRESTCSHKRSDLIAEEIQHPDKDFEEDSENEMAAGKVCQCLQKIVTCTTVENEVIFSDLVLTPSYFPMVSRAHSPIAFFGLPPVAQKPAVQQSKSVLKLRSRKPSAFIPEVKYEKSYTDLGDSLNHNDDEPFWIPADKPKTNYPSPGDSLDRGDDTPTMTSSTARFFPQHHSQALRIDPEVQVGLARLPAIEQDLKSGKEELGVARDLQKVRSELELTQKTLKICEMEHRDMSQQNGKLKLQMADVSAEMDELKAKNISLNTQLELASTKEQELIAEIITIQSQKKELETQLATIQSEKEILERSLDELRTQDSPDLEAPKARAFIDELQHHIGRLQYKVEELEEKLREANGRADRAVTQRNKALIEKYELRVEIDDLVEEVARLKEQISIAPLGYGAGIKRGRSPTLSMGARERSDMGGGSKSFGMDDEGELYGASPPRQMSGLVKSEADDMESNGRLAKKVRRESPEVIELD